MFLFGYIISDTACNGFPDDIVKVVDDEKNCVFNVPKLVVGLSLAKKYAERNGFEFDILEHMFPDGNMWTFKNTEKREIYEENIEEFKDYIIDSVSKKVDYTYINVYKLKYSSFKRLYGILMKNRLGREVNYIFIDRDMIYYPLDGGKVIGLSMRFMGFMGIDREKIISKIRNGERNRLVFGSNRKLWHLKDWFKDIEYVIPQLITNNATK